MASQLAPHQAEVHVTMFDHPIVVDKGEIPGLRAQGLLIEDHPVTTLAAAVTPVVPTRAADTQKETTQP